MGTIAFREAEPPRSLAPSAFTWPGAHRGQFGNERDSLWATSSGLSSCGQSQRLKSLVPAIPVSPGSSWIKVDRQSFVLSSRQTKKQEVCGSSVKGRAPGCKGKRGLGLPVTIIL